MSDKQDGRSFWTSVPGILTGCAALITALGGLVAALYAAGLLPNLFPTPTVVPPTAVFTPVPTIPPPSAPSQTALPGRGPEQTVDNFDNDSNASVQGNFNINKSAGNDATLRLIGIPHVSQGTQALAFEYDIRHAPPRNYVGFDRNLPVQDWSEYSQLCMWVESDGSNRNLVIQFGEHDNNFRKSIFLLPRTTMDYCVPLNTQPPIDRRLIGYYGVYVEGPPQGTGVIYIDNVRLVR